MARLFIFLISLYRKYISPLKSRPSCRFTPHLLAIRDRGARRMGLYQRQRARRMAHTALQSFRQGRIRSRTREKEKRRRTQKEKGSLCQAKHTEL